MVRAGNKAKRLSSVNHTIKEKNNTIHQHKFKNLQFLESVKKYPFQRMQEFFVWKKIIDKYTTLDLRPRREAL